MLRKYFSLRWWDVIVYSAFFTLYFAAGYYLSQIRHFLPHDGMARLVSAYLVWNGAETKLATIGFTWPPLPTLFLLPFTWIKYLVTSWLALVLVSALFMALAVIFVGRIARVCGLSAAWRGIFMVLFGLNPLILVFGANGMSEAILIPVYLGAMYWLFRFWQTKSNMFLIISAFLFGLLPMIRYEMALVTGIGGFLLIVITWMDRNDMTVERFRGVLEGRLLAFSSLVIYPTFLWAVASWQTMGAPFYFLTNERGVSGGSLAQIRDTGLNTMLIPSIGYSFKTWAIIFPMVAVVFVAAVSISIWKRSSFLFFNSLVALTTPVILGYLLHRGTQVPLVRYFVMEIPYAFILGLLTWLVAFPPEDTITKKRLRLKKWLLILTLVAFLASNLSTANTLSTYNIPGTELISWFGITRTEELPTKYFKQFDDGYLIGQAIPGVVPEGARILLDTYAGGYAVILGAGSDKYFLDYTDPNFELALLRPWDYADYVLVPTVDNEGRLNLVNSAHPTLYVKGADWAEFLDVLPETSYGWKLYQVKN